MSINRKMKKLLLILCLLVGCQKTPQYTLYLYYAKTCPICQSFINEVIPEIKEEYGNQIEIIYYDIDEEESMDAYAKTCSLLENYSINDQSGNIPFIVLDGYFAKIGYNTDQKEEILQVIRENIQHQEITVHLDEYYQFQDGKTFR